MKTPVVEIPMRGEKITNRNREQTERLCRYYGYEYITSKIPIKVKNTCDRLNVVPEAIAKFEGVNEGGPFVLVVTLCNGSFAHDQVYEMLEHEHVYFERHHQDQSSSTVEGWYYAQWGEPDKRDCEILLSKTNNPQDLTAAMSALLVLEVKKKQDAAKP